MVLFSDDFYAEIGPNFYYIQKVGPPFVYNKMLKRFFCVDRQNVGQGCFSYGQTVVPICIDRKWV